MSVGNEIQVHRKVFESVFNVGRRLLARLRTKQIVDGRAGHSGRKPHEVLRQQISNFWLSEVDLQPSHYDSVSTKQLVVGINSIAHGWLIFLAKHFHDKYTECVNAKYFPGVTPRIPSSLPAADVPVIACDDCKHTASSKSLSQVVCPHIPKLGFFKSVTGTFQVTFRRPGSDQCEKCNSLHTKIALHRALGLHEQADAEEDRLDSHKQDRADHHQRAAAFHSMRYDLQHNSKRGKGRTLTKYHYNDSVEWASLDLVQSISMDAGSGLRTPYCRVGFAYFSRVLVTNVYWITDHGALDDKPNHCYLWNDKIGGKGPSEIMSIFLNFLQAARTGARRLVVECDGCSGQVFNKFFFGMCSSLVDPSSDLCRAIGAAPGRPIFSRIDIARGEVGHTYMKPDRIHMLLRQSCRNKQYIASIEEYEEIAKECNHGRFRVVRIEVGDEVFIDMKRYVDQSYKLGGSHMDIDNNPIATRSRHWVNFGIGPTGGGDGRTSQHRYGAWRLRTGYDPSEIPCEIVAGCHTKPDRRTGVYELLHDTLGEYESQAPDFLSFEHPALRDPWRVEREITPEKLYDTHKLACLGLPRHKIHLWPCPDPAKCKHERCPERIRVINQIDL